MAFDDDKTRKADAEDETVVNPGAADSNAPTIPPPRPGNVTPLRPNPPAPAPPRTRAPSDSPMANVSLPEWKPEDRTAAPDKTAPTILGQGARSVGHGDDPTIGLDDRTRNDPPVADRETMMLGKTEPPPPRPSAGGIRKTSHQSQAAATVPASAAISPAAQQTRVLGPAPDTVKTAVTVAKEAPKKAVSKKTSGGGNANAAEGLVGATLDGYYIEKLLGAGGMGAVYLAHQVSLDRKVAFKVLPGRFASNPGLLARFTREALSAAHMNHHNVIQVYDVGCAADTHYISMEFVRGQSLGDMIRRDGPLTVDDAAGYVLQACRGLGYAHSRGVIHRDIKPDNIMVNEHGVVKIADMGLAKMTNFEERPEGLDHNPDAIMQDALNPELTRANIAMGTPAYMAPEQARDTSSVDPRADQYSLGCTLYYLCAGRAPYSGTTAFELMSKHMNEPLTPLDVHVKAVPPTFKAIIERMLAKDPEGRYPSLKEAAKDLEAYLGISETSGPFKPREAHLATLEAAQKDYYAAPSQKKRTIALLAFAIAIPVLFLACAVAREGLLAAAFLLLGVLTPLANFVIGGVMGRNPLFRRTLSVVKGMPLKQWALTVVGTLLALATLWFLGLFFPFLGVVVLGVGAAVAYQLFALKPLRAERAPAVEQMNQVVKELRLRGLSEEAIQDFVARFSPQQWQEFFEEFFSYDDMLTQRARLATQEKVRARKKWATWRDPIVRWLDKVEETRRIAKEKAHLAAVEAERLKSEGVSEEEANKQAAADADKHIGDELLKQADEDIVRSKRMNRILFPWNAVFRLARFLVGGLVAVCAALSFMATMGWIGMPSALHPAVMFLGRHGITVVAKGVPPIFAFLGLFAGMLLMMTSFARSVFAGGLATLGGVLVIFSKLLPRLLDQEGLDPVRIGVTGLLLLLVGAVAGILGRGK